MFSSHKNTTKIKWLTIALMLVVVFVGSFNPTIVFADEGGVAISNETPVEPEVAAIEEEPAQAEDSLVSAQPTEAESEDETLKDNISVEEVVVDTSGDEGGIDEESPEIITDPVITDSTSIVSASTTEIVASSTIEAIVEGNNPVLYDVVEIGEVTPQDNHIGFEDISAEYGDGTSDLEIPNDITENISLEYSWGLNTGSGIGQEEISIQYSFHTEGGSGNTIEEIMSREYSLNTLNNDPDPVLDEEISRQYSFTTLSDIGQNEEISRQYSFTTEDNGNGGDPNEEVSREYSFRTLSNIGHDEEISDEYNFITDNGGGGPDLDEEISEEYSFRTQVGGDPDLDEEVSSEYSFTTNNNDGGCTSNCGGGGGGHRHHDRDDEVLPTKCLPLILEYIRFGRNNNPIEVLKLQWFLRTFEGFDVPLSGYYDRTTYEAVRIFQTRYADPILTSWGISEPTGFVFISTSLNINYIYCDIQGAQFDLRNFYKITGTGPTYISMPKKGDGAEYLLLPPPIQNNAGDEYMILDVDLPREIAVKNEGFLQVAMIGLLNFFGGVGEYLKDLGANLMDWFRRVDSDLKDRGVIDFLKDIKWWMWLLGIGFLMIIVGLILIWKRLRDLKIENSLLEESNQEMIEAEIELDNLESIAGDETLESLVEEYNEHMDPEELQESHLEHISETLKEKVIELEGKIEDKE